MSLCGCVKHMIKLFDEKLNLYLNTHKQMYRKMKVRLQLKTKMEQIIVFFGIISKGVII